MTTEVIVLGRGQAEGLTKDILNSLDHSRCETVLIYTSDDPEVQAWFQRQKAGYQAEGDGEVPPHPDALYIGNTYVVALQVPPETIEQMVGEPE